LVGLLESRRLLAAAESLTSDLRLALATVGRIHRDAATQVKDHRALLRLVEDDPERAAPSWRATCSWPSGSCTPRAAACDTGAVELASYGDLAVRLVNTGVAERPEDDQLTDVAGLRVLLGERRAWAARAGLGDLRRCGACVGASRGVRAGGCR
jgi:hypothetical protein